jgi:cyanophycinase
LLRAYRNGVVFGGYSAGTAIASKTMITGVGDFTVIDPFKVEVAEGLGLVTRFVVDQHFIARQRQNRLLSVLQKSKENLGIGIDEDTALVIEDEQRGSVLGSSYVTVFQRKSSSKNFEVSLLKEGDSLIIP